MSARARDGETCHGTKKCTALKIVAVTTREVMVAIRGKAKTITIPLCAACAKDWDDKQAGDTYWA